MSKNTNLKKLGLLGLAASLFATIIVSLLLINPLYANASQNDQEKLGFSHDWDSNRGHLTVYSKSWCHQTLEESDMDKVLDEIHVAKKAIKHLVIRGMNYIDSKAIQSYYYLEDIQIDEPKSTAIRMSKDAICNNYHLQTLKLGGVEWLNTDGDRYTGASIHDNPHLLNVEITYDNWSKYYDKNISSTILKEKMDRNGIAHGHAEHIEKMLCKLDVYDRDDKTNNACYCYYDMPGDHSKVWKKA